MKLVFNSFQENFPFATQFIHWFKWYTNITRTFYRDADSSTQITVSGETPLHERIDPVWDIPDNIVSIEDIKEHKDHINGYLWNNMDTVGYLPNDLNWLHRSDWGSPILKDITCDYERIMRILSTKRKINAPLCFAVSKDEQRLKHLHEAFCQVLTSSTPTHETKPFHHRLLKYLPQSCNLYLQDESNTILNHFQALENALSKLWERTTLAKNDNTVVPIYNRRPFLFLNVVNDNNGLPNLYIDIAVFKMQEHEQQPCHIKFDNGEGAASPLMVLARLILTKDNVFYVNDTELSADDIGYSIPDFMQPKLYDSHILNVFYELRQYHSDLSIPILYKKFDLNIENSSMAPYLARFKDWQPYNQETVNALSQCLSHSIIQMNDIDMRDIKNGFVNLNYSYDLMNDIEFISSLNQTFEQSTYILFALSKPQVKLTHKQSSYATMSNYIALHHIQEMMSSVYSCSEIMHQYYPLGFVVAPAIQIRVNLLKQFEQDFGLLDDTMLDPIVLSSPLASHYANFRNMWREAIQNNTLDKILPNTNRYEKTCKTIKISLNCYYTDYIVDSSAYVLSKKEQYFKLKDMYDDSSQIATKDYNLLAFLTRECNAIEEHLFWHLSTLLFNIKTNNTNKLTTLEAKQVLQFAIDLVEIRENKISQTNTKLLNKMQQLKKELQQQLQNINLNTTNVYVKKMIFNIIPEPTN